MCAPQRKKATLGFGPYGSPIAARMRCQAFIDAGFPPEEAQGFGIIGTEPAGTAGLRAPDVGTVSASS
jgi:hypothetical protein